MKHIAFVALALVLLALARPAAAAKLFMRLDPRLTSALAANAEPVTVWVDFADKGEQGPSDLQHRLDLAEQALTPAARARRLRAHVQPLVDALDLPVEPAYVAELAARGYQPYGVSRWLNGCCVRTSGAALAALGELPFVSRLSPAPLARTSRPEPMPSEATARIALPATATAVAGTPAFYGLSYAQVQQLNVPALHDSGYTGAGEIIAMLDDGFNYYTKHDATKNIDVIATRDFVLRGNTAVQDTINYPCYLYFTHGMYTLSCVGGCAPGSYVGTGYGASFALARTEDDCSEKPVEMVNWALAAEWADSLGADVISSSLGYMQFPDSANDAYDITPAMLDGHTTIITRAVEIAASKGILCVNSAGNSGPGVGTLDAPADAAGDSMLAVGAITSTGTITSFSSRGPTADGRFKPDVVALGSSDALASASGSTNTYVYASGTSFSCPLVAGLAACLLQARPDWTPVQVIRGIKLTADRGTHPDNTYGWGLPSGTAVLGWTPDTAGSTPGHPTVTGNLLFALSSENPVRFSDGWLLFEYQIPGGASHPFASMRIYDVNGRRVRTLMSAPVIDAQPRLTGWDGRDDDGRQVDPGLYFARFEAQQHNATLRVVVLR